MLTVREFIERLEQFSMDDRFVEFCIDVDDGCGNRYWVHPDTDTMNLSAITSGTKGIDRLYIDMNGEKEG